MSVVLGMRFVWRVLCLERGLSGECSVSIRSVTCFL
jgi:hypothetical protein